MLAKYWDTTTDKPEEDCEFDFILTSELRFGWGMHLVTEELQIPQYELSEIEIRRANNIRRNRGFLDRVQWVMLVDWHVYRKLEFGLGDFVHLVFVVDQIFLAASRYLISTRLPCKWVIFLFIRGLSAVYPRFICRLSAVYPRFIRRLSAVYPRFIRYLAAVYPPFIRGFSVVYSAVYP